MEAVVGGDGGVMESRMDYRCQLHEESE